MMTQHPATPEEEQADRRMLFLLGVAVLIVYGPLLAGQMLYNSDVFPYLLGQKLLLREEFLAGRLPQINPFILCGAPLLADIVAGTLYPLNVLLLIGPPLWAFHLFVVAHYGLSAVAFYALLRRGFGVGPWLAAAGAAAYSTGGYLWSVADHGFFQAGPWVPLFWLGLLGVLRSSQPRECRRPLLTGLTGLALLLYSGNFQQAYDAMLFGGGVTVVALLVAWRAGAPPVVVIRRAAAAAGLVLAALLLAAPQLLPTVLATLASYRANGVHPAEAEAWSFPFARLVEYGVPFAFGLREGDGLACHRLYGNGLSPWSDSLYIGIPLLLGVGLLRRRWREWPVAGLAAVGLAAFVLACGHHTPVYDWVYTVLPGFRVFRHPEKYLFWVHLALAALGAIGLEGALATERDRRVAGAAAVWVAGGLAAAWVGLAVWRWGWPAGYAEWVRAEGSHTPPRSLYAWQSAMLGVSFLPALALGWWWRRGATDGRRAGAAVLLATALPLAGLAGAVRWTIPVAWFRGVRTAAQWLPAEVRSSGRIHSNPNLGIPYPGIDCTRFPCAARQLGGYARLVHNAPSLFRVRAVLGFSALAERSYLEFVNPRTRSPQAVLDLLCVSRIVVRAEAAATELPPGVRVDVADTGAGYAILASTRALPRIYATREAVVAPPERAMDTAFALWERRAAAGPPAGYPPVVVSEPLPPSEPVAAGLGAPPPPSVERDDPGHLRIATVGPAWLVVRDWFHAGWRARLDQAGTAPIARADGGLMAVYVPAGRHTVELDYRAPGLLIGIGLALLGLGLGTGAWVWLGRGPRS